MKKIILFTLFAFPMLSLAEVQTSTIENNKNDWAVEAIFNTTSDSTGTTFGPSIYYKINNQNFIGFRFNAPVGNKTDFEGTYTLAIPYRLFFSERKTSLFTELNLALNSYSIFENKSYYDSEFNFIGNDRVLVSSTGASMGTYLGVIHNLNSDISFGGLAGLDWSNVALNRIYRTQSNNVFAYTRISIFSSLNF